MDTFLSKSPTVAQVFGSRSCCATIWRMQTASKDRPVAVVTGGAGGLGSAICKALADAGMSVVVGYNRSADAAQQVAKTLPGNGHCAWAAPVTDSGALKMLA